MNLLGKKIIVVEDEEINIYLLRALLKKTEADVIYCKDADEFFQKYTGQEDVVLLDIKIPGRMDGKDILKEIKIKYPEKPVIMQSAYTENKKECEKLGADDFIEKPYIVPKLLESIKNILKL